jgi:predicted NUDIX family phosphoesterase
VSKYDEKVLCLNKKKLFSNAKDLLTFGMRVKEGDDNIVMIMVGESDTDFSDTMEFVTRREAGDDPDNKLNPDDLDVVQVIPYIITIDKLKQNVVMGVRSDNATEKRLAGKTALGLGGHINDNDVEEGDSFVRILMKAASRELEEELSGHYKSTVEFYPWFDSEDKKKNFMIFFYDQSEEVSKLHLGVLMLAVVEREEGSKLVFEEGKDLTYLFEDYSNFSSVDVNEALKKIQPSFESVNFEDNYALGFNYLKMPAASEALEMKIAASGNELEAEGWTLTAAKILSDMPKELENVRDIAKYIKVIKKLNM